MQKAASSAAAYPQAVSHAQAALSLLDRMPRTEERRLQRVELLLEAGRVLWQGAGPDDSFTLPGALRVLESARASLHAGDPPELVADLAATIAGVLHEIGDVQSLTRALEELSNASRALAEAGMPQGAARLFNDQASTLIRLGDPVRAAHLLTESRKIFQDTAKTDPIAMVEMAETDHLFARILLQVPARPGREDDALSLGLDHAIAAERAFRRLGAPREVGRVLETMGRIELRKRRLERAAERITAAVKLQESIGDVIGLARSTAALSEVFAAGGQIREALNLLGDSVVLNFEKGSSSRPRLQPPSAPVLRPRRHRPQRRRRPPRRGHRPPRRRRKIPRPRPHPRHPHPRLTDASAPPRAFSKQRAHQPKKAVAPGGTHVCARRDRRLRRRDVVSPSRAPDPTTETSPWSLVRVDGTCLPRQLPAFHRDVGPPWGP